MKFEYDKATNEEKIKFLERENLELRKSLLELQYKLLPYQYNELNTLISKHEEEQNAGKNEGSINQ